MKHYAHFTPPQSYLDIDIMDEYADTFICTLRYPKPPLYPLYPINMKALEQFIYERRPSLKGKCVSIFIEGIAVLLKARKHIIIHS